MREHKKCEIIYLRCGDVSLLISNTTKPHTLHNQPIIYPLIFSPTLKLWDKKKYK